MTQEELAEALTVTVGYVSQMERGVTKISLDRLSEVAGRLACGLDELVSGAVPAQEDYLAREMDELYRRMDKGQRRLLLALGKTILEQEEC